MMVTPAWWCERCESWWPGAWLVVIDDDEPDAEAVAPYTNRTCPECGDALVPRGRPVA